MSQILRQIFVGEKLAELQVNRTTWI